MQDYPEQPIHVPRFNEENGFYTTRERSVLMAKIKAKDTKAEVKLRKVLWSLGYRYRVHVKKLPGRPDIVFHRYKLAIFVDGEFWHGYQWEEKKHKIKSNRGFWIPKIERNMQRDRDNDRELGEKGWQVLRFWERDVHKNTETCIEKILALISR